MSKNLNKDIFKSKKKKILNYFTSIQRFFCISFIIFNLKKTEINFPEFIYLALRKKHAFVSQKSKVNIFQQAKST